MWLVVRWAVVFQEPASACNLEWLRNELLRGGAAHSLPITAIALVLAPGRVVGVFSGLLEETARLEYDGMEYIWLMFGGTRRYAPAGSKKVTYACQA